MRWISLGIGLLLLGKLWQVDGRLRVLEGAWLDRQLSQASFDQANALLNLETLRKLEPPPPPPERQKWTRPRWGAK